MYLSFKAFFKVYPLMCVFIYFTLVSLGRRLPVLRHSSIPSQISQFSAEHRMAPKKACIPQPPLQQANGMCAEVMAVHSESPCEGKRHASFHVPFPPSLLAGMLVGRQGQRTRTRRRNTDPKSRTDPLLRQRGLSRTEN